MENQFKFLNKEIPSPVGIIIVILVAIWAGGIIAWQYFGVEKEEVKAPEEKAPVEKVVEDKTADWKTYRNEEYEFEVKYPQNVCFKEEKHFIEFTNCEFPTRVQITIQITDTELAIHDYLKQLGTEEKAERLYSRKCDPICLYTSVSEVKDIYINDIPAVQMYAWLSGAGGIVTFFKKSPKTLIEIVNFCIPEEEILEGWVTDEALWECFEKQKTGIKRPSDIIYDQIISTFKF